MAESKIKYVLHYGGQEFALSDGKVLDDFRGDPGTIKFRKANGDWLTIAVGPGIPVLVEERTAKERTGTILY